MEHIAGLGQTSVMVLRELIRWLGTFHANFYNVFPESEMKSSLCSLYKNLLFFCLVNSGC